MTVGRRSGWTRRALRPRPGSGHPHVPDVGPAPGTPRSAPRARRGLPALRSGITRGRRLGGAALALAGLTVLTATLTRLRRSVGLPGDILLFLPLVVAVALVGGLAPALTAAVATALLLNWFFVPPLHTLSIGRGENLLALVVFVAVAIAVSAVVDLAARRSREAARARLEAETLSVLARCVLRGEPPLPTLLARTREALGLASVRLDERAAGGWRRVAAAGVPASTAALGAPGRRGASATGRDDIEVPVTATLRLVLSGHAPAASDEPLLAGLAAQAALALEWGRLSRQAQEAEALAAADAVRTALLSAVGHDLRTPLAGIKAAVSTLRQPGFAWSPEEESALLAGIETSTDRLTDLVANLLDVSRLTAGALPVTTTRVGADEVVARALAGLDPGQDVGVEVPESLPPVVADPGLLERVLANLVGNAVRHSPTGVPPTVSAALGDGPGRLELRVVDHGPGVALADWERMFLPFQRLGDRDHEGLGLGLAVARGFTEAMGGTLRPRLTPGGGLTMVVELPLAAR